VWEVKRGSPGDYLVKNTDLSLQDYLPLGTRVGLLVRYGTCIPVFSKPFADLVVLLSHCCGKVIKKVAHLEFSLSKTPDSEF
jgi:hypothetical protein